MRRLDRRVDAMASVYSLTSRGTGCDAAGMNDRAIDRGRGIVEWVHECERCGAQMEEQKCKIVCKNCGNCRDCSDP